jgi:hypothetical protein
LYEEKQLELPRATLSRHSCNVDPITIVLLPTMCLAAIAHLPLLLLLLLLQVASSSTRRSFRALALLQLPLR